MSARTITVTKEVRACPVDNCEEEADSILAPGFCRTHLQAFYAAAEGRETTEFMARKKVEFLARMNGTKVRSCTHCGRWGTSDEIGMGGPEGGEEPFCNDRRDCDLAESLRRRTEAVAEGA